MTNFRYRDLAEAIGILAIVASLIFVGLQIKQSHEIAMASTYQARSQATQELKATALSSPDLVSALTKIYGGDYDDITPSEYVALDTYFSASMSGYENLHYQHQQGFLPDEHWENNLRELHCWFSLPIYREIIDGYSYRASFQNVLDEVISTSVKSPDDCWSYTNPIFNN